MLLLKSALFSVLLLFMSVRPAQAIIVVIPVILIPIVNIVVWIIGALATPVLALSTFYFKLKKRSPIVGLIVGILILIAIGIIAVAIFKLINPQRPLY